MTKAKSQYYHGRSTFAGRLTSTEGKMTKFSRRLALKAGLLGSVAACSTTPQSTPYEAFSKTANDAFNHGVASGDPDTKSVVIWTRISVDNSSTTPSSHNVQW